MQRNKTKLFLEDVSSQKIMAEKFTSELLGVVIAQIAQTIGYSRTQSAPLELLEDILLRFIQGLARDLHSQVEHANRIEPNLKDALLSLKNVNINILELLDYIGNVEPIPFVRDVPAYPVKRHSNMNFLKPGSAETLTRPVHIFEYLPPMLPTEPTSAVSCSHSSSSIRWPEKSEQEHLQLCKLESNRQGTTANLIQNVNHVNNDFVSAAAVAGGISNLSSTDILDHDGHVIREISSVVMTTGGFISPAIEGKLPEAYVPDIIEKFKGLDAPSVLHVPKSLEVHKDASNDAVNIPIIQKINSQESIPNNTMIEQKPFLCDNPTISKEIHKCKEEENSAAVPGAATVSTAQKFQLNIKSKKIKKKNIIAGQTTNDLSAIKAVDKARRKALKMCQKLSKNQIEGYGSNSSVVELKKMKILNRGILSDLSDGSTERTQIEKQKKKQTKQRQKQLKNQKQQQQQQHLYQSASKFIGEINTMQPNPFTSTNSEPLVQSMNEVAYVTPVAKQLENKDTFNMPAPNMAIELIDEIKLDNEPDRNKLNIIKKISKQKANKLNIASNLYENANNVPSPLINLPSGTTITPAPPTPSASENISNTNLNMSLDNMAACEYLNVYPQLPIATNDLGKPKKRGRKPGGKNQCKLPATSISPLPPTIQMQKKTKAAYQEGTTVKATLPTAIPLPFPMPLTEPLNLSHVDQLKNNINLQFSSNPGENKFQKAKEKKERKKSKAKCNQDNNIVDDVSELNNKISLMDSEMKLSKASTLVMGADSDHKLENLSFVTSTLARRTTNLSSSNNEGMPMLPLLHFPPRPGLIPTGPGLFPPNLNGFNKSVACGTGTNLIMPHSFMNFSTTATDNKATVLSGLMPLSDIHMERSYCNVAPLVPDSMKLTATPVDGIKLKSPHRLLNNECTDAEVAHRSHTAMSMIVQVGKDESSRATKAQIKLLPAATGNIGDPIEVSDSDSNDTESKTNNSLIQSSNLMNPIAENSQLYSVNANSLSQPQFSTQPHTGPLKVPQADSSLVVPPASTTTTTATTTATVAGTSTPFNINFMGRDKFSLAGGADLIPLSRIDSGLAYSSLTVPSRSLAVGATSGAPIPTSADLTAPTTTAAGAVDEYFVGSLGYDDVTITPTNSLMISELKIRKLHKKFKKPKEGKIKKKKDKKDKVRNKNRSDETVTLAREKSKSENKKLKKDKKRKKQLHTDRLQIMTENQEGGGVDDGQHLSKNESICAMGLAIVGGDIEALEPSTVGHPMPTPHLTASTKLDLSPNHIPKLTLKLSGRSTPTQATIDGIDYEHAALVTETTAHTSQTPSTLSKREHSPELARFSPLVTRAPKPKQCETQNMNLAMATSVSTATTKTQDILHMMPMPMLSSQPPAPSILSATSTISASSVLLPQQLMKPSLSPSKQGSRQSVQLNATKISEIPATSTATQVAEVSRPSSYVDADGYRIWICPACGKVDDGSAMIGCDGCDAWYHWICVGILVAPKDNEDWFCRVCVSKKKVSGSEKKKKRNKKK